LTVKKPEGVEGRPLRLVIAGIAGADRVFEWDGELTGHDLP